MWTLVIFYFAGVFADGDSVAVSSVPGFESAQMCEQAKAQVQRLATGKKDVNLACVRVK